jgi:hypothetical protein
MSPSDGSSWRSARALRVVRAAGPPRGDRPHLAGDLLLAWWQKTLDAASRDCVDEHLLGCAVCRGWLAEVGRLFRDEQFDAP